MASEFILDVHFGPISLESSTVIGAS